MRTRPDGSSGTRLHRVGTGVAWPHGDRGPVVRGRTGQERYDDGGGQRGDQHDVVAQRLEHRHVRQHHPGGQRHDQDDRDGPHIAVRGLAADPADEREQHPQHLVLPGGGRDGDGDAAGHRDGEQQLSVTGVAHRAAESDEGDGRAERQEETDLQRPGETEPEERAVQGLVGEVVGVLAEADARQVVHPVRVRVVRHRGPGERGEGGERGPGGGGGAAAAGEPEKRREEQHGRLEGRREPDEDPADAFPADDEAAEQDEQHRDDAGLAEVEGVAYGERQHQQADGHGRGEQ